MGLACSWAPGVLGGETAVDPDGDNQPRRDDGQRRLWIGDSQEARPPEPARGFYAEDADFCAVIGCETGDAAATLDELRRRWCLIDDDVSCRFYADVSTPSTFVSLRPGAGDDWMSSLDGAVEMVSEGPLFFDASMGAFKV